MKKLSIFLFLIVTAAVSQAAPPPPPFGVYPFEDNFDSYNPNAGSLDGVKWTAGSTTFKAYGGHGLDSVAGSPSTAMARQFNDNSPKDSIVTKYVDSMTVNTELTFHYRFVETTQYPNFAATLPADAYLRIYANDGFVEEFVSELNASNYTLSSNFNYFAISIPQFAGGGPGSGRYFKLVFYRGSSGDYWLDIDNFRIGEPIPVSVKKTANTGKDWSYLLRGKTIQLQDQGQANYSLYNVTGTVVKTWQVNRGNYNYSMSDLPNGIYFLRRNSGNSLETKKILLSE
jgi:hypothetical protein